MAGFAALMLVLVAWALGGHITAPEPVGVAAAPGASARWQPWSPQAVQTALAQGKPVFVDFTAAWCVTCQVNKKTVFASEEVLKGFDAHGVQTMRADWTRRDAAISAELSRLGRSGVPVYLLQAPGRAPVVLSELPSVAEIQAALAKL
jgi:thiol:disulfide interchange protein DsbD